MLKVNNFVNTINFASVENVKHPEEYLKKTAYVLNKYDTKWYLSFGTALGMYRDKDFILGDTDIDISILTEEDTPIDIIADELTMDYHLIRSVMFDDRQMQLAFQGKDNFIIDLTFFYPNEYGVYSYCEGGMWQDKSYKIGSLKTKYGKFPIPVPIKDYLKARYGDWKTPRYGEITCSIKA